MSRPSRLAGGLLLAAFVASTPAFGQANYRLAPVGGRTTLVGGTGLVYGRDGASVFLNPATAVRIDDKRLSFSVNFYTMTFVHAPSWYRPGLVDTARFGDLRAENTSLTDFEFNALPSSLCFFFKVGDIPWLAASASPDVRSREARLGVCFATIQGHSFNYAASSYDHVSTTGITRQAQSLAQSYNRFALGPTYAMHITDDLALGASFHASLASHRSLFATAATSYGAPPNPIHSSFYDGARGDAFQLTATIGTTYRLGAASIGLAVETPSIHIFGAGAANLHTHFEGSGQESSMTTLSGSFMSRSPLRVALGTGIEGKWGQAEVNVAYNAPLAAAYRARLEGRTVNLVGGAVDDQPTSVSLSERARGTVNVGAGAQVFIVPKISVLGGVSTDLSAVPELNGNLFNYFPSKTTRVTASAGIGSHGEGGDLLLGTELSFGWGDRLSVNSYQLPPRIETPGHSTVQLLFVIAGSTSLKAITRAVKDVREVIDEPGTKKKPPP
ncbi:MAG: hypothetical protein KF819_36080 [Labilithrix sp.]|nr:hypothetical protein [Labilithrix sp.]